MKKSIPVLALTVLLGACANDTEKGPNLTVPPGANTTEGFDSLSKVTDSVVVPAPTNDSAFKIGR